MLTFAVAISEEGVYSSKRFLEEAGHPLPQGFDKKDVNWDAPKAYTDEFVTLLKFKLVQDASVVLTLSLGSSSRQDIRAFYENQLKDGATIINMCLEIMQQKELRLPVRIPFPEHIEKIKSPSFLGTLFHHNRPLSTAEIFQLVTNFESIAVVSTLFKSFAGFDLSDMKN